LGQGLLVAFINLAEASSISTTPASAASASSSGWGESQALSFSASCAVMGLATALAWPYSTKHKRSLGVSKYFVPAFVPEFERKL
jgi:hypothetical protein